MIEYKFDTQLLIEGTGLDEDAIYDYFVEHFKGDCLLVVGDEDLIKIHYHTNEPWLVCSRDSRLWLPSRCTPSYMLCWLASPQTIFPATGSPIP